MPLTISRIAQDRAGVSGAVQVDAFQSPATPRPSDRFGNAVPCAYAALEWSGSTWRIQVGLSNLPRITSAAATQHLSKRPLRVRVPKALSQEQLAVDAGVGRAYVSRLERGENPTVALLERLAAGL